MAALLLARNTKLTPNDLRSVLIQSARGLEDKRRDVGVAVIERDAKRERVPIRHLVRWSAERNVDYSATMSRTTRTD